MDMGDLNIDLINAAIKANKAGDSAKLAELIDQMEPMELREFQKETGGFFGFTVR